MTDAMATPGETATPKANRGNRRRGRARGYNGQKGGSHTLSWREDRIIGERLKFVRLMNLRRQPANEMLPVLNQLMVKMGEPEITLDTVYDDIKRAHILMGEEQRLIMDKQSEHIAEIDYLIQIAYEAWHESVRKERVATTPDPQTGELPRGAAGAGAINRDRLLATIRQAILDKARFDGSLESGARYGAAGGGAPEMPASPMEMLAAGLATPHDLEVYMKLTAVRSGVAVPALPGEVIEGEAVELHANVSRELKIPDGGISPSPLTTDEDGLDEVTFD